LTCFRANDRIDPFFFHKHVIVRLIQMKRLSEPTAGLVNVERRRLFAGTAKT